MFSTFLECSCIFAQYSDCKSVALYYNGQKDFAKNQWWPESVFLVPTKRKAGSGDEIGSYYSRKLRCFLSSLSQTQNP